MSLARPAPKSDEPSDPDSGGPARFEYKASDPPPIASGDSLAFGKADRLAKYAWLVLLYNLAAVAWGVFVRAGRFGDGCGSHWPLCDGNSEPLKGDIARTVEMSHRVSTGLVGPLVLAMLVWTFRVFPKGHFLRKASVAAMGFTLLEGLVGAALVKFGWVVNDDSPHRAAVMSFHVVSTFLLLGSIAAVAFGARMPNPPRLKGQGTVGWILGGGAAGLILLGVSGAISALGHQLNPVDNVLQAAMDPMTFWMVRLQPFHPLIATAVGLYILLTAGLVTHLRPDPAVRRAVNWMIGLYGLQFGLGLLNIWLKAPIAMQMIHLVMADLNWLTLVVVAMVAFAGGIEKVEKRPAPLEAQLERAKGKDLVKAYVALTKPRVISLLLVTSQAAMIAAKGEWPGLWPFMVVLVGGYMAAGSANAINMVVDRDIDLTMKRTATRPTVTQAIPTTHALLFSFALAVGSFALFLGFANLLAATLAFSGLVFYVVIYTLLLKRRTWHNIVIGGAAGAVPPLVGWAAVTNELPPLAWLLFGIIFVWTPVHFWALAIMIKDEYKAAGVPMLPLVKGDRNTAVQIFVYAALTCVATMAPFFAFANVGWLYAISAGLLNAVLIAYSLKLYRQVDRPRASALFHYSMLYLALLFVALAVDRTVVM
ncbi:MAG TPA: heme o synthase [Fimbriimonas sp.]